MLRLVIVLISSHGHFQYNLPALEQIQLVVSTRIASVARQDAVPIKFLDIFQIMNIMYRSFREVETADHPIQRADDMQLIAIIVSLLRSTESLVGCSIIFLPADRRARTTADPAYLQRHTVYNQIVWSRGDVFAHTFAKGGQMGGTRRCDGGCRRYVQFGFANNRAACGTIGIPSLCPYILQSERGREPPYRSYGADDADYENSILPLYSVMLSKFFRNLH